MPLRAQQGCVHVQRSWGHALAHPRANAQRLHSEDAEHCRPALQAERQHDQYLQVRLDGGCTGKDAVKLASLLQVLATLAGMLI